MPGISCRHNLQKEANFQKNKIYLKLLEVSKRYKNACRYAKAEYTATAFCNTERVKLHYPYLYNYLAAVFKRIKENHKVLTIDTCVWFEINIKIAVYSQKPFDKLRTIWNIKLFQNNSDLLYIELILKSF